MALAASGRLVAARNLSPSQRACRPANICAVSAKARQGWLLGRSWSLRPLQALPEEPDFTHGPAGSQRSYRGRLGSTAPDSLEATGLLRACQGDFFGERPTGLMGVLAAKRNEHQAQSFHREQTCPNPGFWYQARPQDSLQPRSRRPCSCRAAAGPAATEGMRPIGAARRGQNATKRSVKTQPEKDTTIKKQLYLQQN